MTTRARRKPRRLRLRFEVRETDSPVTCETLSGLDVDRLPYAVWDSQRGLAFGELVCVCASEEVAKEIAVALENVR